MKAVVAALCGMIFASPAQAGPAPIQVMVLGTWHMDDPGQDLQNLQSADVLTPQRQSELAAAVRALAAFKPTVVAVERVTAAPSFEDALYRKFTEAQLGTDRDERVQVGYRLAQVAGLDVVHGIDEQPTNGEPDYFPFERVQAMAHAHGQDAALGELLAAAGRMVERFGERQAHATVTELLLDANDPRSLADPGLYYELLALDAGEDQPASELLGYWYMRNAKIFAKLRDVTQPGDRVVVVFGAGHKHWLEQLARYTPGFEVVDIASYLPAGQRISDSAIP